MLRNRRRPMIPSLTELEALRETGMYDVAAVKLELLSDSITPIALLRKLREKSSHVFLFESAEHIGRIGRWTFLGFDPELEATAADGVVNIRREKHLESEEKCTGEPKDVIRKMLSALRRPEQDGFPPFSGGFAGYFSYDYIKYSERRLKERLCHPGSDFRDMDLMLFRSVIAFDNYRGRLILMTLVDLHDLGASYRDAGMRLQEMAGLVRNGSEHLFPRLIVKETFCPAFDRNRYREMVKATIHHIHEGDIFQAVISNPMSAAAEGSLFDTYRVLRTSNPSPYMFYLASDDIEIAGASPETLLKLEGRKLSTYPLAGTRPRGRSEAEDRQLERDLLSDEKEVSEHNMLVDLGRNDIGKVAEGGTVEVADFHEIVRFSHVMHISSTVTGTLAESKDGLDAIEAILPAGTLSGAPKIRAAEIIDELEGISRGVYGGAIGYIDLSGNLDMLIAIRLAYLKNGRVTVHTGSGIVADSDPDREAAECLNKAQAVLTAYHA